MIDIDRVNLIISSAAFLIGMMSASVIWTLWIKDNRKSWLLFTLAISATATLFAGIVTGFVAYIRATGAVPFPGPVTTLALGLLFLQPVWLAIQFVRHGVVK